MRLIARKPCRFNGRNYYIGDEIPAKAVSDPQAQEKMGVLTIANMDPGAIYTQADVDQKVQEAKKELESQIEDLTGQVSEKDAKIKELEQQVEDLRSQVSPAAISTAEKVATTAKATSKKTSSK